MIRLGRSVCLVSYPSLMKLCHYRILIMNRSNSVTGHSKDAVGDSGLGSENKEDDLTTHSSVSKK